MIDLGHLGTAHVKMSLLISPDAQFAHPSAQPLAAYFEMLGHPALNLRRSA